MKGIDKCLNYDVKGCRIECPDGKHRCCLNCSKATGECKALKGYISCRYQRYAIEMNKSTKETE